MFYTKIKYQYQKKLLRDSILSESIELYGRFKKLYSGK